MVVMGSTMLVGASLLVILCTQYAHQHRPGRVSKFTAKIVSGQSPPGGCCGLACRGPKQRHVVRELVDHNICCPLALIALCQCQCHQHLAPESVSLTLG